MISSDTNENAKFSRENVQLVLYSGLCNVFRFGLDGHDYNTNCE